MLTLITPTADRGPYLRFIHHLLQQQSFINWEWWICDSSYCPSKYFQKLGDKRIHYLHIENQMTIGEKRNFLIEQSTGEWIAHIDDDDYYAASYLEEMMQAAEEHDFLTLSSWYLFDVKANQAYYWQADRLANHPHYMVEPLQGVKIKEFEVGDQANLKAKNDFGNMVMNGYGFSYLYKRAIWEHTPFLPINHKEDSHFLQEATEGGFSISSVPDLKGIAVKIVHDQNVSTVYPQYRIPPFLMERYLPHFTEIIDAYYPYHNF